MPWWVWLLILWGVVAPLLAFTIGRTAQMADEQEWSE